jgi:hypothetical protein
VLSLHIVGTDVYYDVALTSFSGGGPGGGFSWTRSRAMVIGCMDSSAANYDARATIDSGFCGDWTFFHKPSDADPNQPENQDCITPSVCITRAWQQPIYNVATEIFWDDSEETSPADTRWATGFTSTNQVSDYGYYIEAVDAEPPASVYAELSMHLITDDQWHDVVFTKWVSNGRGGGFAYYRRPAAPAAP